MELFEMLLGRHLNMQMWKVLLDSKRGGAGSTDGGDGKRNAEGERTHRRVDPSAQ